MNSARMGLAAAVAITGAATFALSKVPAPPPAVQSAPAETSAVWDHVHPLAGLTPGVIDLRLTLEVLSAPGFTTKNYRNVPESEKESVYRAYGVTSHKPGEYEVDHLISLEIGGANDRGNLWPEKYDLEWQGFQAGAHTKDRLEDYLAAQVRAGRVPLGEAQQAVRTDWIAAYRKYLGELPKYAPVSGKPEGE